MIKRAAVRLLLFSKGSLQAASSAVPAQQPPQSAPAAVSLLVAAWRVGYPRRWQRSGVFQQQPGAAAVVEFISQDVAPPSNLVLQAVQLALTSHVA